MFTLTISPSWLKCDIYDKFEEAAKRRFKAIEILNWQGLDLERIQSESKRTGVSVSAILFQSSDPEKQRLIANTHGIVHTDALDAFVDAIKETIAAAKIIGTKNI